jgi:hypothetical protein
VDEVDLVDEVVEDVEGEDVEEVIVVEDFEVVIVVEDFEVDLPEDAVKNISYYLSKDLPSLQVLDPAVEEVEGDTEASVVVSPNLVEATLEVEGVEEASVVVVVVEVV